MTAAGRFRDGRLAGRGYASSLRLFRGDYRLSINEEDGWNLLTVWSAS